VTLTPQELASLKERNPNAPSAVMVVPMLMSERIVGAISIENISTTHAFGDHEAALLSALGDYAAIAIENARNFQQLEEVKERETMAIRGAFELYVAPGIIDRLLSSPTEKASDGQRFTISVLVAEIRGVTTWSEQAAPEQVIELLNEYFTLAADIIFAREGTLEKFPGDSITAFFNAPQDQDDHAYRAVDAALALQAAAAELNARRGNDRLSFSIGLNMGNAVVGNLGLPRATTYSAVGEAVNVARQLQEHAKPGQILIAENMVKHLDQQVDTEPIGEVQMAGGGEPVAVYSLRGLA
jgi:adenylate cyclase